MNYDAQLRSAYVSHILVDGCIIDGSHDSADGFAVSIISEALTAGWLDAEAIVLEARFTHDVNEHPTSRWFTLSEDSELAYEVSEDAVSYLNEIVAADGHAFGVEESCLYYQADESWSNWQ